MPTPLQRQRGTTLVIALVFLVILTMFAISGVNTGIVNLRTANNQQMVLEAEFAAQQQVEFGVIERRRLAGGSGDHDRLGATVQLQRKQAVPRVEIYFAGGIERCRQRGDAAGKSQMKAFAQCARRGCARARAPGDVTCGLKARASMLPHAAARTRQLFSIRPGCTIRPTVDTLPPSRRRLDRFRFPSVAE